MRCSDFQYALAEMFQVAKEDVSNLRLLYPPMKMGNLNLVMLPKDQTADELDLACSIDVELCILAEQCKVGYHAEQYDVFQRLKLFAIKGCKDENGVPSECRCPNCVSRRRSKEEQKDSFDSESTEVQIGPCECVKKLHLPRLKPTCAETATQVNHFGSIAVIVTESRCA